MFQLYTAVPRHQWPMGTLWMPREPGTNLRRPTCATLASPWPEGRRPPAPPMDSGQHCHHALVGYKKLFINVISEMNMAFHIMIRGWILYMHYWKLLKIQEWVNVKWFKIILSKNMHTTILNNHLNLKCKDYNNLNHIY